MTRYFDEDELKVEEPRPDAEVTLSWTALAGLGLGLFAICALCFGFGYMVGHRGPAPAETAASTTPQGAPDQDPLQGSGSVPKPSATAQAAVPPPVTVNNSVAAAAGASPQTTAPGYGSNAQTGAAPSASSSPQVQPALGSNASNAAQTGSGPMVRPALPSSATLMVQVAAVRNLEDASVLTTALRKRGYPVSEQREPGDGLIHVRVGPFTSQAEANQWRDKLLGDGYNAVVQP